MDPIVTTALVGTARQERVNLATGTSIDELINGLAGGEDERKLLLSAGTWAVYRLAGQQSQQIAALPEPAAPEKLRSCTPAAALLLSRLLNGEQAELLSEALARWREAGLHIPYHLLPLALSKATKAQRPVLFPLLGERGRWLSQFNPAWNWVHDFLSTDESGLPADAETIWQEGTAIQRVEILRRLRAVDPEKGRAWLVGVWKQEKADVRCDLLHTLETGLNAADEEFLEKALDDRAPSVRLVAASILASLPDSAFIARMCARGSAMLKRANGAVEINLPAAFGKDWARDGLVEKPPSSMGQRAWWLIQILQTIPLTFWESHLGAGSTDLLEMLPDNEWRVNVISGWSKATVTYRASGWATPLWNWWLMYDSRHAGGDIIDATLREKLMQCMSQAEAEKMLQQSATETPDDTWHTLVAELPKPWSVAFAQRYLQLLRAQCSPEKILVETFTSYYNPWFQDLPMLALALPIACFSEALQPWDLPEPEKPNWHIQHAQQQLREFTETVHIRQKINEEII